MEYKFRQIEEKWQRQWEADKVYEVSNNSEKPKCYVLDMFPYPSGAGLHVGHPLGYIASDIYSRYKRLKGFNVLHPMGYDAFGLPAEQYAIEHGAHPADSTAKNIATFRGQLDKIGFCFDWSRQVKTSDPNYYKWTQWIFLQLFNSWYNRRKNKTEPIASLVNIFSKEGNKGHPVPNSNFNIDVIRGNAFTAQEWEGFDEKLQQAILMEYRTAYCGVGTVNWCEALGTVLANDEVVNGVSERGGHPVVKKKLRQWYLRITEYAERLLDGLNTVDFTEAMKDMQSNWIGKSEGAEIEFRLSSSSLTPTSPDKGLTPNPSPRGEGGIPSGHYFQTSGSESWKILKEYARENRKNKTEAENIIWQKIRNNQLGIKARRQHDIQGYIVDFAFLEASLVIEIDGGYHDEAQQQAFDKSRTEFLNEHYFLLVRFTNEEAIEQTEEVISKITSVIKEQLQKKQGASVPLLLEEKGLEDEATITVYTTRPDTIFGVDFMVLAPEHELIEKITTLDQKNSVEDYIAYVKSRSDRERIAEKKISGVFTGAYAINPFNNKEIPVWISEYVLAGYGTGAIMGVPSGDERDHRFAKHFNLPVTNIFGDAYTDEEANSSKDAVLSNSDFLNGLTGKKAMEIILDKIEEDGIGKRKINYKIHDAAFSRQRYWGEPFPIKWVDGVAHPLNESELPLELPHVDIYKPGPDGEGPLANIPSWVGQQLETNTMPGYAGSSWYFLRYMDPHNEIEFADRKATDYWNQVDVYVGGTEHAVGHLLYSRMWTKALYDLGFIGFDEPYKKLLNQGMIQGSSRFVYRIQGINQFVSYGKHEAYATNKLHVDVNIVDGVELDMEAFRKARPEYADAQFITEDDGRYICGVEVEKMSKSKVNTVNPDQIVEKYGADTFRMYEMFLGPVEMSKPWDTKGIEGVYRFLRKLWRLFFDEEKGLVVTDDKPSPKELKVLHRTIKKIEEDTERFSFNTAVSAFMVCVNELQDLHCHKREILESLLILLVPYAPHISEELWQQVGNSKTILDASFPRLEEKYLVESVKDYPVSINGKMRTQIIIDLSASQDEVQKIVLADATVQKWMEGKPLKKFIFVKGKMINVVI